MRCLRFVTFAYITGALACANSIDEIPIESSHSDVEVALSAAQKRERSERIKAVAAQRGITNAVIVAGVAHHESGLAQCWSEATWACQGPASASCGGPSIAGAGDGPCSQRQGGIGMFQLDAGTHSQTLASYGSNVVEVDGNIAAGVNIVISKVRHCPNTPRFDNEQQVVDWINRARPGTAEFETFLSAMAYCYNGCRPSWSCHEPRRRDYRRGVQTLLDLFGQEFWNAPAAPAAASCEARAGGVGFNCAGPIEGMYCTQLDEPADPHTWEDNYFCTSRNIGAKWSSRGPIDGMRCTQVSEAADPHTWEDNYLCVHPDAPYTFSWSSAGPIDGKRCVQWREPADPHTWDDNFLCFDEQTSCDDETEGFAFSCNGAVDGMHCAQLQENADPHTWSDNWFCSVEDIGLQWSSAGPIAGADCVQIIERADPHTWEDNYLCTDPAAGVELRWSGAGPIAGLRCVRTWEPADPHTWDDNYVCF